MKILIFKFIILLILIVSGCQSSNDWEKVAKEFYLKNKNLPLDEFNNLYIHKKKGGKYFINVYKDKKKNSILLLCKNFSESDPSKLDISETRPEELDEFASYFQIEGNNADSAKNFCFSKISLLNRLNFKIDEVEGDPNEEFIMFLFDMKNVVLYFPEKEGHKKKFVYNEIFRKKLGPKWFFIKREF